jgi:hypothetical protein
LLEFPVDRSSLRQGLWSSGDWLQRLLSSRHSGAPSLSPKGPSENHEIVTGVFTPSRRLGNGGRQREKSGSLVRLDWSESGASVPVRHGKHTLDAGKAATTQLSKLRQLAERHQASSRQQMFSPG